MAKLEELKALAADLRKRLRQVDQLTGRSNERDRDTRRNRELRAASKRCRSLPAKTPKGACSVLFAATGSAAQDSLQSILGEIETNERLRADYLEVCVPVLALEYTPRLERFMPPAGRSIEADFPLGF